MRRSLPVALISLVLVVASSIALPASAQGVLDFDVAGGHFYRQANGRGGEGDTGYSITDTDGIRFWDEFQRLGAQYVAEHDSLDGPQGQPRELDVRTLGIEKPPATR